MIHEDERRILFDFDQSSKTTKIVVAKDDCSLGDHYHKIKTETFMLVSGLGTISLNGSAEIMEIGKKYTVNPKVKHQFSLQKGSVLICLVDKKYNPNDDYR